MQPMPAHGKLTLRQAKFVDALTTPNTPAFCKPSASYRVISPTVEPQSARVGAMRMSTNVNVQEAIRGQLGLAQLGGKLKKCLRESERIAKAVTEPTIKLAAGREQRETVMDYAKLTGQLVERHAVATVDATMSAAIRALVAASLASRRMAASPQPATETRPHDEASPGGISDAEASAATGT